jgi:hypothetical protein
MELVSPIRNCIPPHPADRDPDSSVEESEGEELIAAMPGDGELGFEFVTGGVEWFAVKGVLFRLLLVLLLMLTRELGWVRPFVVVLDGLESVD